MHGMNSGNIYIVSYFGLVGIVECSLVWYVSRSLISFLEYARKTHYNLQLDDAIDAWKMCSYTLHVSLAFK